LAGVQIRPYVRYRPEFTEEGKDKLDLFMISENLSPIPAKVIYDELRFWINGSTGTAFLFNRTGDILYQTKPGGMAVPRMPALAAKDIRNGTAKLMVGTCVIYGSISPSDQRRWEVKALYSYTPNAGLAHVEYLNEVALDESADRCDAATIFDEWMKQKQKPPH